MTTRWRIDYDKPDWNLRQIQIFVAVGLMFLGRLSAAPQGGDNNWEQQNPLPDHWNPPPSPVLTAAESMATFQCVPGFRVELVASEPLVEDPVAMTFDEYGRIWVVEMRGLMHDINGAGETEPIGRIKVLLDENRDGRVDSTRIFEHGLVMPRTVTPYRNGALVANSKTLWFFEDLDGDLVADRQIVIDPEFGIGGNVEHSPNGLLRGLDNWYYNAKSSYRYREISGIWVKEKTEFRGQWGISKDNYGRLYYNYNWDQLRADLIPPNYLNRNPQHLATDGINVQISTNQTIHPIRMNTGVNRAYRPNILDERGRLREFTSACSPIVYRGNQFPKEFIGDVFVLEPAAHLIKRNRLYDHGVHLSSEPAYHDREFLASSDERFRPVWGCGGPDGALYIVDLYRGILQHKQYMTSHLRGEILSRSLDKGIHLGRIYRIVSIDNPWAPPQSQPNRSLNEWIKDLAHPSGTKRDTAQRILVEKSDRTTMETLWSFALNCPEPLGKIHALWTLEGMDFQFPEQAFELFHDPHPMVVVSAVRIMEIQTQRTPEIMPMLISELRKIMHKSHTEIDLQIILTLGSFRSRERIPLLAELAELYSESPLFMDAALSGIHQAESKFLDMILEPDAWSSETVGRKNYLGKLASIVVKKRQPVPVNKLLHALSPDSICQTWKSQALLSGIARVELLTNIQGIPLESAPLIRKDLLDSDEGALQRNIASLKRIFEWPGHRIPLRAAKRGRPLTQREQRQFEYGESLYRASCAACHGADGSGLPPLGPPLHRSDWVQGSPQRLVRILLHGMEGPLQINGETYQPPVILPNMPSVGSLDNGKLSSILTYIRREWGHQADPVSSRMVEQIRTATYDRELPWTEKELLELD